MVTHKNTLVKYPLAKVVAVKNGQEYWIAVRTFKGAIPWKFLTTVLRKLGLRIDDITDITEVG